MMLSVLQTLLALLTNHGTVIVLDCLATLMMVSLKCIFIVKQRFDSQKLKVKLLQVFLDP